MSRAIGATMARSSGDHLLAAAGAVVLLVLWASAIAVALHAIGTRPDRTGPLLAVFPGSIDATQVLARVSRAEGSVIGGTWLANVWQVHGVAPNFAGALRAQGATLVLPLTPMAVFGAEGCFGMPVARDG